MVAMTIPIIHIPAQPNKNLRGHSKNYSWKNWKKIRTGETSQKWSQGYHNMHHHQTK